MGQLLRRAPPIVCALIGMPSSGKTALLYRLQRGEVLQTIPTHGFNIEQLQAAGASWELYDMGGPANVRATHVNCFSPLNAAVILVVDSTERDAEENAAARAELSGVLAQSHIAACPLLVFANKQDLPNPMTADEVAAMLGLEELMKAKQQPFHVQACSVKTGAGLEEGMAWLAKHATAKK